MRTRVCSSGGDSLTSSERKLSRTAALPRMLICLVAVKIRSLSAPHVGQVLASGREVGGSSQSPLCTACTHTPCAYQLPRTCVSSWLGHGRRSREGLEARLSTRQQRADTHCGVQSDWKRTFSHDASCSGSCSSGSFFFLPPFFGGMLSDSSVDSFEPVSTWLAQPYIFLLAAEPKVLRPPTSGLWTHRSCVDNHVVLTDRVTVRYTETNSSIQQHTLSYQLAAHKEAVQ